MEGRAEDETPPSHDGLFVGRQVQQSAGRFAPQPGSGLGGQVGCGRRSGDVASRAGSLDRLPATSVDHSAHREGVVDGAGSSVVVEEDVAARRPRPEGVDPVDP